MPKTLKQANREHAKEFRNLIEQGKFPSSATHQTATQKGDQVMTTEFHNSIRCCNQPMRYDRIDDGAIFNDQRLTGTYYCERCCTMRPTYEPVGNTEHSERLRNLSKSMSYSCWMGAHGECDEAKDCSCEHHQTQPAPDTGEWRVRLQS